MKSEKMKYAIYIFLLTFYMACVGEKKQEKTVDMAPQKVKIMTLDPGHFHAALVQNTMYAQVDSTIHVYAPDGTEVEDFLSKIKQYNSRENNPTGWKVKTHLSSDFLRDMLVEKPGNVMIVAGKNSKKIDYILEAVKAGLHVYADKPLVIDSEGFEKLKRAFEIAKKNNVLIYDIMTERFETTTVMQKLFSTMPQIFGELSKGSIDQPAISKESVHHFSKIVSGKPLVRPSWFFDIEEEGEGIVDVTTHLVDLVQWEAFPDQIIDTTNIEMIQAKRWPTVLTQEEFQKVTGAKQFPHYLQKDIENGKLKVYSNGEMIYKINGTFAKVSVIWNYEAPGGTGDTHYSIMRGTKSDLVIKQGKEEDYRPVLYINPKENADFESKLIEAVQGEIAKRFPGTSTEKMPDGTWRIAIPDEFKIGHEAHFGQVTENYLKYLEEGKLPDWEVPNMIAKYYTTIEGRKMALNKAGN